LLVLEISRQAIGTNMSITRVVTLCRDLRKCAPWEVGKANCASYFLSEAVVAVAAVFIFRGREFGDWTLCATEFAEL
jgi:hypothetical protein